MNHDQERATCTSTTTTGTGCRAYPLPGREVCFAHDPTLADARAAGRPQGGRNRATVTRLSRTLPTTLGDLVDLVVDAARQAHEGRMPPAQARAVAACARAGAAIYADHCIEDRLDAIEAHLTTIGRPLRSVR